MVQLLLFLTIGTYNPDGVQETGRKYEIGYDHQSLAGKLSCRTALKRCTKIEILWYRKLVSRASPEFCRNPPSKIVKEVTS